MTTPSTPRKAGPLNGNGSTTAFPFAFKVFAAGDIKVTIANSQGVETVLVLNTDYSVSLNANQETSPGGTVTYPISGSALPVGSVLAIIGDLDYDQPLDLPSGGNFSPTALENQLDRSTMQIQQLREEMDRTAKLPPTSSESVEDLVDDLQRIADSADNLDTVANNIADINTVASDLNEPVSEINTVAGAISNVNTVGNNIANVNTVAGISANVTTVAGIQANVTTVAGIAANVSTVAGISANVTSVAGNSANINAVAGNATNINAVAGISANVTTVAGISANVTTVAGISADVQTVADNVADVTNFADVYQGAKTSDPTLRNDGSALQAGDLYFNTSNGEMRVYGGTLWKSGFVGTVAVQNFSGNGSTTAFTLATAPGGENNTQVYIGGVYQQKDQYSVSGVTLTFSSAPPTGTDNIEVVTISTLALGETDASLVSFLPTGTGAVERTVQSKLREFVSVKDFGAVGDGVTNDSAAIQLAINAVGNGGVVYFPPASYRISSRLTITSKSRVSLVGNKSTITCDENIGFLLVDTCDNIEITGFRVLGTFDTTTVYLNNAEQGRIVPQNSTGVNIHNNEWKRTSGSVFVQTGCNGVFFHHNRVIETHGGIQTSGAVYKNLWITDNYFLGHVFTNAIQGSDDQIAVFGTAGGQVVISRNVIDKQGPTAYNQARAINVSVGSGANSEIIVSENIVKNVVTTTAGQARPAIEISGATALRALSRATVKGNIITNCNIPIAVGSYASNILLAENNISQAVVLAGYSNSGNGIQCNTGGLDVELVIKGNLIQGCGSHGVGAASSYKILIDGNYIKGSTARGISLDACQDLVISNNILTGNQDGIFINNSQRLAISGNTSTSNTRYGLRIQGTTVSGAISGNVFSLNASADFSNSAGTADVVSVNNYGTGAIAISGTSTTGRNLRGSKAFSASTTAAVTFSVAEPDANYHIAISAQSNHTYWVSSKTTTGFTLNCSASVSNTVDWILIR